MKKSNSNFHKERDNLSRLFLGDSNTQIILGNMMKYSGENTRLKLIAEYIQEIVQKNPNEVTTPEKSRLLMLTQDAQKSPFDMKGDYQEYFTTGCKHTYHSRKL
ncbi:MAG: hypothetical protein ACOC3Z_01895 [Nanoarchaeota archaeon]